MPSYTYDHIHLRSRDPRATAEFYERMFDARIIESIQSDGAPRIDLDLNGLTVFIARVGADQTIPQAPPEPYLGLDHFGLRVDNLDEAAAELKRRGASFSVEPHTLRPGVRIAFLQCPDNVRIELLERTPA
jgi:catechol 2,3-dioxygenase-like lactoylglutathione lyase family enzyme